MNNNAEKQYELNKELAQMLKGGVIMDVTTPEQAKIAEEAGACAVMALERIPADIRAAGGVSRMSDPKMIRGIQEAVSIPVMAKCRIGHFAEAQILEAIEIDYIDESEVLSPAEEEKKDDEPVIDIEPKEEITFDDFEKMQFQVGEIIACEEVKKSKKLLCSQVKIGSQVKQIVSGIKKHYSAEEMVGKKVMVLVNLKPAKLAGVLSEGMLLCAEDENGELSLMVPEKKMPAGAEIC